MARVSFNGVIKEISVEWLDGIRTGDYIIAHAGSALSVLDPGEAEETLELFRQMTTNQRIQ